MKLKKAVRNSVQHNEKHRRLLAAREAATIAEWTALINNWVADPADNPNPFFDPPPCKCSYVYSDRAPFDYFLIAQTIADVLRQLAAEEEEAEWMQENPQEGMDNGSSPSEFIYAGMELEQQM